MCCGLWACDKNDDLPDGWEKDHCEGIVVGTYNFEVVETKYVLGTSRVLMDTTYESRTEIARAGDTILFQGTSTERFLYSHANTVCHVTHISSDSSMLHF